MCLASIEAPYGTAGTMVRDQIWNESFDVSGLAQNEIKNDDQRFSIFDHQNRVPGYRSGSKIKFKHAIKAPSAQLISGATPATGPLGTLLKALQGGELAAAGSAVATATSQTSIIVTAADGAKFPIGSWVLVGVGGVLQPARVSNRVTDTLTFSFGLSAPTATSQLVVNTYGYYPTQTNNQSLNVQFGYAKNDAGTADAQWAFSGCTGEFSFDFSRDKVPTAEFDLAVASPSDPTALSLSLTPIADTMTAEFPARSGQLFWQPATTAANTGSVHWESFSVKYSNGMAHVPTNDASGLEGTCGVMRSGDVRPYAVVTIKARYDAARYTDWLNRTPQQLVLMLSQGAGTTKRYAIFDYPTAIPYGMPKTMTEGGRLMMELSFECQQDAVAGANAPANDAACAPARHAFG